MKRLALIAVLAALASPAAAQFYTQQQLGGGTTFYNGTDANGDGFNGTRQELGNGHSFTQFNTQTGPTSCTSTSVGSTVYTNCW